MSLEKEKGLSYNVVFINNRIITWTSYESKQQFEELYGEGIGGDEVIAQGVSQEKAIALARSTPTDALIDVAVQESIYADGKLDLDILDYNLTKAALAIALREDELPKN